MDNRLRENEKCVIGLPQCGYAFSSARSCFIAYGFEESSFEVEIIKSLLEEENIQPLEAGEVHKTGQLSFCTKICSKIITAQFCIVFLNNDTKHQSGQSKPNANVYQEYGMMMGFNKYIIPFQREHEELPFNVKSLETVKYTQGNFKEKAKNAIKEAVQQTQQTIAKGPQLDQKITAFLLSKAMMIASIDTQGDRDIYNLGNSCGFNLLTDFSGMSYCYLGLFMHLPPQTIIWRMERLNQILLARVNSIGERVKLGILAAQQLPAIEALISSMAVWIIVNTDVEKAELKKLLQDKSELLKYQIFAKSEIESEMEKIGAF